MVWLGWTRLVVGPSVSGPLVSRAVASLLGLARIPRPVSQTGLPRPAPGTCGASLALAASPLLALSFS